MMEFTKLSTKPLLEKKKALDLNLIKIQRLRFEDIYALCLLTFGNIYILSF